MIINGETIGGGAALLFGGATLAALARFLRHDEGRHAAGNDTQTIELFEQIRAELAHDGHQPPWGPALTEPVTARTHEAWQPHTDVPGPPSTARLPGPGTPPQDVPGQPASRPGDDGADVDAGALCTPEPAAPPSPGPVGSAGPGDTTLLYGAVINHDEYAPLQTWDRRTRKPGELTPQQARDDWDQLAIEAARPRLAIEGA